MPGLNLNNNYNCMLTEDELKWLSHLKPFRNPDDIPSIPKVDNDAEKDVIASILISCGAIPKDQLIVGKTYEGSCRNATKAVWNGTNFDYKRYKFGMILDDTVPHFEDEKYYDVFIPIKQLN